MSSPMTFAAETQILSENSFTEIISGTETSWPVRSTRTCFISSSIFSFFFPTFCPRRNVPSSLAPPIVFTPRRFASSRAKSFPHFPFPHFFAVPSFEGVINPIFLWNIGFESSRRRTCPPAPTGGSGPFIDRFLGTSSGICMTGRFSRTLTL